MDLTVDRPRQISPPEKSSTVAAPGAFPAPMAAILAAAHRDMAALDHPVGQHDVADQDEIEIGHGATAFQQIIRRK